MLRQNFIIKFRVWDVLQVNLGWVIDPVRLLLKAFSCLLTKAASLRSVEDRWPFKIRPSGREREERAWFFLGIKKFSYILSGMNKSCRSVWTAKKTVLTTTICEQPSSGRTRRRRRRRLQLKNFFFFLLLQETFVLNWKNGFRKRDDKIL